MREILFRVWDKVSKKYREFDGMHDTITINKDGKVEYYNLQNGSGGDDILEQFAGLVDRNGNKIFEGDILCANTGCRWEDGNIIRYPQYAQVIYNTKKARFEILGKLGESHKALNEVLERCRAVVVGNIHENPELLTYYFYDYPTIPKHDRA